MRGELKVWPRVFEVEIKMADITPAITDAIKGIKGVIKIDRLEDMLTVYCSEDLKAEIEKVIKDSNGVVDHIKSQGFVSKALVDFKEGEIVLRTDEEIVKRPRVVSALLGDT